MNKELLIYQIKELLFNPLIKTSERLYIEPILESVTEEDLHKIKSLLEKKISILNDTQSIFYDISQAGESVLDMDEVFHQSAAAHPFFDLTLENLKNSISNHLVDYLKGGINLIDELELYIQSQHDLLFYDGPPTFKVYDEIEFYNSILQAVKDCNQKLSDENNLMTVKSLIKEYEVAFPINKYKNRGGFEEESFVSQQKISKATQELARKILLFYDFLIGRIEIVKEKDNLNQLEFNETKLNDNVVGDHNFNIDKAGEPAKTIKADEVVSKSIKEDKTANILTPASIIPIVQPPQAIKSTKPALIFDLEDEAEADKHRAKAGAPPVLEHVLRQYVDEVIKTKNLIFKDEVNRRRFVQLMVSRLKDVRGSLEIAEALRKPVEAGGLGMSEEKADQVLKIVEQAKKEFENRAKVGELKASLPEPPLPPPATKPEPPQPAFDAEAAKQWRNQMLQKLQNQSQPITPVMAAPIAPRPMPKPQLTDVKAPPKVVGPLEELRGLTLVDFRRLGDSPEEALQKIQSKIDLLGETSIARRVEAVRAWKSSVVYQQYLRLGRESIEQGKPVSDIVKGYEALGEPVLTEQEFNAIADFNTKLRF